ncbi:conserved hypothetical protein [Rippkaea orientalis PCC 8801]|uniref:Fe2OG dioxygenase domain-containing protein n=1 Tax=Rippkaea orientalis (strain PCC 8801 / RF-1) TaxID=41431 RepID=B7K051_RIPO1|nr:2OG-Fe(II) oxygenase family protein [Rippkaea orientalis]ACK66198.1 conserved hypothetical protein [Rippkaea orientalis PCC 8801]
MPIETWFPLAIYYTDLEDAPTYRDSLKEAVLSLEKAAIEKRSSETAAWTGDVHGVERIYDDPRFAWIVEQVQFNTLAYLKALGIDFLKIDLYIQRAWPVISRKSQNVGGHRHHNSNISAVYYISVPKTGQSGNLIFFNDAKMNEISPGLGTNQTSGYAERNSLNSEKVTYAPKEGRLIIFPSKHRHAVGANQTGELRISLSFDIVMTCAQEGEPGLYEFLAPPPSQWKRFE